MQYETKSVAETKKIAKIFAQEVKAIKHLDKALVVIFKGDLGAGKTAFVQGFMRELGIKRKIVSPTFTLLRSYAIKTNAFKKVHHFDCYRINDADEMKELGFKDLVKDPENIVLIEWPERIQKLLPREKVVIELQYGETINERTIEIK